VDNEDITIEQVKPRWFIDLDWYQQNNCSFSALTQKCLCAKCRERLTGDLSADELLATIKDCCSQPPDFITGRLPILESIFRLFLANGNHPLDLEELGKQLTHWRGSDTYRTSPEILSCLLKDEQYYGIRQVPD